MEKSTMEAIANRLSLIPDLHFPRNTLIQPHNPSQRKSALFSLLSNDPPIFLERYGNSLTLTELSSFHPLISDYEVRFHVDRLRRALVPTAADSRAKSAALRNRRRAYMDRLVRGGEYFSEEGMREREPFLHYEYVGRFQDLAGRGVARPGERWSETLLRRCEEAVLVGKVRREQRRLGVRRRDWVGGEGCGEEEESEEEEGSEEERVEMDVVSGSVKVLEDDDTNANGQESAETQRNSLSAEEMQDQMDQFAYVMQQKFLAGEDSEYLDYAAIDNDEGLDDHWIKEANHDAEEKYFDED